MYFEYDIFLSYKTSNKEVEEWISNLRAHLSILLGQILNKPINIISSREVETSSDIMMSTGVFVAIETQEYLTDSVEQSYLAEFNKLTKGKRIFKIVKEQLQDKNAETELLKSLLPIDFSHADLQHNQKINHDKFFKTEAERLYWLKVVDLAYVIYKSTISETDQKVIKNTSKIVFVAETSKDQIKFRDIIVRELQSHGYKILPDNPLPYNKIDFEQQVLGYLKESNLAIHILGEQYGELIEGGKMSRVEVQNRLASEVYKVNKTLERLIWVSPQLENFEGNQNIYLEQLKKDINELEGAELVQTPLEIFKTIIRNKLSINQKQLQKQEAEIKGEGKSIYVINGQEDKEKVTEIENWIEKNGYHLIKSDFDGKRGELVENHRKKLALCDGVIIFYAHSNPQWIKMKLQDLIKAPGFGRKSPMLGKAIYTLIDEELPKTRVNDLLVINQNGGGFNSDGLKELVIKMGSK